MHTLSAYHHRGKPKYDGAAMRSAVTHTRGRFPADQDRRASFYDAVRRTHANAGIADYSRRKVADQYCGYSRTDHRPANMRNWRWHGGCLHRAGMHIRNTCG